MAPAPHPLLLATRQSLRHPDLTPLLQVLLLGSAVLLMAIMLFRFSLVFRNRYAGLVYRYPTTWTAEQTKVFRRLRLTIGACLLGHGLAYAPAQRAAATHTLAIRI
jgi:hypothetical protein